MREGSCLCPGRSVETPEVCQVERTFWLNRVRGAPRGHDRGRIFLGPRKNRGEHSREMVLVRGGLAWVGVSIRQTGLFCRGWDRRGAPEGRMNTGGFGFKNGPGWARRVSCQGYPDNLIVVDVFLGGQCFVITGMVMTEELGGSLRGGNSTCWSALRTSSSLLMGVGSSNGLWAGRTMGRGITFFEHGRSVRRRAFGGTTGPSHTGRSHV